MKKKLAKTANPPSRGAPGSEPDMLRSRVAWIAWNRKANGASIAGSLAKWKRITGQDFWRRNFTAGAPPNNSTT